MLVTNPVLLANRVNEVGESFEEQTKGRKELRCDASYLLASRSSSPSTNVFVRFIDDEVVRSSVSRRALLQDS